MNYKINEARIMFSPLGDEAVIFDREKNEYITLNVTMFAIFKAIGNNQSSEAIQAQLINEYEIGIEACKRAVERSISELSEKGFIVSC